MKMNWHNICQAVHARCMLASTRHRTALQIGNLMPLLALRRFQLAGHRPVILVGGATGLIGDPGGRDSERELKPAEEVRGYVTRIRQAGQSFSGF